jgi:putative thioredoxin
MTDSPYVVKVTSENFNDVVIEASRQRPVLVDFWAEWCAPCRSLMPVLEKLASEYGGRLIVAKLNTEEEQSIAAQFGIRSLPTVQLFMDGRPVGQFMGALPESQVREFLERHLPRESDAPVARAMMMLDAGDAPGARNQLEQARSIDPENPRLLLAESRILAAEGNFKDAETLLARVPSDIADDPDVVALRGRLQFLNLVADSPPEADLEARLDANGNDSEARYLLAAYRAADGDYRAALEHLLTLLKRDRSYGDDAARKGMLRVFDLLGGGGELVSSYRTKMLNALY